MIFFGRVQQAKVAAVFPYIDCDVLNDSYGDSLQSAAYKDWNNNMDANGEMIEDPNFVGTL